MDKLWAPWRIKYIKAKKKNTCIFCAARNSGQRNYVVVKTVHSVAMLNLFPYNNGHMLVCPKRHVRDLAQLNDTEMLDLFRTVNRAKELLGEALRPSGYNIGINMERAGGAGIAGHLHIHIVPRWEGDTNFMPVLCDTKIISQSLDELYKQLKDAQSRPSKKI